MSAQPGEGMFREYSPEELKQFWDQMVERSLADEAPTGTSHVAFRIGAVKFAIDVANCRGVVPYSKAMPLPNLPTHILGVTSVRGVPISVTDLRYLAGMGTTPPGKRGQLVIIEDGADETALLVDWVYNVEPLDLSRASKALLKGYDTVREHLIANVLEMDGEHILVLDAKVCIKAG